MRTRRSFLAVTLAATAVFVASPLLANDVPDRVFVVNTGDRTVSLVDLQAMEEIRRIEVGESPYGVAVSSDGRRVAIGVEGASTPTSSNRWPR